MKHQREARDTLDSSVLDVAGGGAATELGKAMNLLGSGQITDDEYSALKPKILA